MAETPAFHSGLTVDASPHIKAPDTTAEIMKTVSVALLPCLFASVFYFGAYALFVVAVSIISAVLAEMAFQIVRRRPNTVSDGSAVVTGLILGLNLPPSVPLYIPVIGSVFAIVLVKMLFGGLGRNFANPAATARVFLMLAYTGVMTRFVAPNGQLQNFWQGFDGMTSATPLGGANATLSQLVLGTVAGSMGETCKIAVLIGFVFLLQKKVISWHIPVCYVLSFAFFTSLTGESFTGIATAVCSGGLLFGAWVGAFLGFAFGVVVLLGGILGTDPFTAILFKDHPVLTSLLCLGKGAACGAASAWTGCRNSVPCNKLRNPQGDRNNSSC